MQWIPLDIDDVVDVVVCFGLPQLKSIHVVECEANGLHGLRTVKLELGSVIWNLYIT